MEVSSWQLYRQIYRSKARYALVLYLKQTMLLKLIKHRVCIFDLNLHENARISYWQKKTDC